MQRTLDGLEIEDKFNWSGQVVSLSYDETRIIRWIMDLHNSGLGFDLDPCYSIGRFWKGLPEPRYKLDRYPQVEGLAQADAAYLPVASESVDSIMFDPPFVIGPSDKPGIIRDRFECFKNAKQLWHFYGLSLEQFYRVLKRGGLVAFKCQDIISGGKEYWSHIYIINKATEIGFRCVDLFVLGNKSVIWSPNMKHQQHARKNHCYFVVLRKE